MSIANFAYRICTECIALFGGIGTRVRTCARVCVGVDQSEVDPDRVRQPKIGQGGELCRDAQVDVQEYRVDREQTENEQGIKGK